jgi:predicted GIY-YIG superfamily endonuclease
MYVVYRIEIEGITRYIGLTNDITRREKQHNYLCFKAGKKKALYDEVRKVSLAKIELIIVKTFTSKVEAKRFECLLILTDHFNKAELWQKVPRISDM